MVAKQHISSASLEGPYWWKMNFPPLESITEVRALHSYRRTSLSVLSISGQLSPEDFRLMSLQGNTAIIPDSKLSIKPKHAWCDMQGLKAFQDSEGVVPDIVSIATNYWDIAAL